LPKLVILEGRFNLLRFSVNIYYKVFNKPIKNI
jgi:hypothetical protein